jgi:hypothetical protein
VAVVQVHPAHWRTHISPVRILLNWSSYIVVAVIGYESGTAEPAPLSHAMGWISLYVENSK